MDVEVFELGRSLLLSRVAQHHDASNLELMSTGQKHVRQQAARRQELMPEAEAAAPATPLRAQAASTDRLNDEL